MNIEKKLIQALMSTLASAHPPLTAKAHISTHIKNYIFNAAREQQSPNPEKLIPIEQIYQDHYHAAITAIINVDDRYRHASRSLPEDMFERLAELQVLDIINILDDLHRDINTEIEKIIAE